MREKLILKMPEFEFVSSWESLFHSAIDPAGKLPAMGVDMDAIMKPGKYAAQVFQKSQVKCKREGFEAKVITFTPITSGMRREPHYEAVTFDRPFAFFLIHKHTGMILGTGTFCKP